MGDIRRQSAAAAAAAASRGEHGLDCPSPRKWTAVDQKLGRGGWFTWLHFIAGVWSAGGPLAHLLDAAPRANRRTYQLHIEAICWQRKIAEVRVADCRKLERPSGAEGLKGREVEVGTEADQQRMPGVLKAEKDDCWDFAQPQGSIVKSVNMADDTNGRHDREREHEQRHRHPSVNGAQEAKHSRQVNGDVLAIEPSHAKLSTAMGDRIGQLPPEIEHITFGYLPFSDVITRLVQETFNGLSDCIKEMSELQTPPTNGAMVAETQQANVRKKLRLLNFAQERRAQFIKILVLSQWSRQVESISRVIDMKVWLDRKKGLYEDACNWIGELKRILGSERMPNPDLKAALEALSLGKAPGLPDLGYIPPEPLSSQQLLKAIWEINTQLSLRLHLHETIPPAFRDFSVVNGRATFRVSDEFEVDLSIADNDLSSQLYFIDFRFAFEPTPAELPQGHLRNEIEQRVNDLLGREGLKGCYRFLHDFVLSHKLNIFRQQAHRLSQERWSEHLRIEAVHLSVIIQYWISRPGGKNWIEIGIRRRKGGRKSWFSQDEDEPHIGLRWFRAGKEVRDVPATANLRELSVEAILKQTISAHTNLIFKETRTKLRERDIFGRKILNLKHTRSATESADSRLSIQLTASQACTIIQEPVTGRLALLPPSSIRSRAERELNSLASPEKEAASIIAQLRAIASCDEVEGTVRCHGWEVVNTTKPNLESLRQHFGHDTLRANFFRKRAWDAQWLLAFTASLAGDMWWIAKVNDTTSRSEAAAALVPSVQSAFEVPMSGLRAPASKELTGIDLLRIECTAVGLISQYVDTRQLHRESIPHKLVGGGLKQSSSELPTLFVHFPGRRAQKFQRDSESEKLAWSSQNIKIFFKGVDAVTSSGDHLIMAQKNPTALRSHSLNAMIGECVKFHPTSGAFAFRLSTPVGHSNIPAILDRLARIQRLRDYLATLQALRLPTNNLSLDHLEFTYAPDCHAHISFASTQVPPQLSFHAGNPHLRIQDQLIRLFRESKGFHLFIQCLELTLPLMRAFTAVEAAHTNDKVVVLPRSLYWYQTCYEVPPVRFEVKLRQRRGGAKWFVQPLALPNGERRKPPIQDQLDFLLKDRCEDWVGLGRGVAASVEGVELLLKRIDNIFQVAPSVTEPAVVTEPAPSDEKQDFKGQKRKAENESAVVVLD
ncbi:MAG: hypothetical protein Q9184_001595 [Pyrenodesmia sp. 2 TL-2023]